MLAGLLWDFWSFLLLFSVIHFGSWIEYIGLAGKISAQKIDRNIAWFLAFCGFVMMLIFGLEHSSFDAYLEVRHVNLPYKIIFWALLFAGMLIFLFQNKALSDRARWICLGGFIYISLSITLFLNLRDNIYLFDTQGHNVDLGKMITCAVVFSIWINDTMAYLVGSMIGRTPFSKISPKKTWEGTLGGALLCVLAIGIAAHYIPVTRVIAVWHWVAIAAICAVFGTAGDLFESKLKRLADVKDSGSFMPGHGGFLDRFDSLLVAVPFVWIYVKIFI